MTWRQRVIWWLVVEKFVQHVVVTLAFYFDWQQIGATVVVEPMLLMVAGGVIALLFALAFWGGMAGRGWAIDLVITLAVVDIVGEFVAQGRLAILITISFLVACVLLVLALGVRREWRVVTHA